MSNNYQERILALIERKAPQKQVARLYARALIAGATVDWELVHKAITTTWTKRARKRIKHMAYRYKEEMER